MSICTLFQRGMLRVEEKAATILNENGIDPTTDPNFITDEEIKKKLSLGAKKIGEWLATVDEPHILDRVYSIAMECDLPMTKISVLQKKMPDKDFIKD